MDKTYKEIEKLINSTTLTKEQKTQIINQYYSAYNQKLQDDLYKYLTKKWGGFALEVGSTAIPLGGVGRAGAAIGENVLKHTLGKKLSQEIGSGALSGLTSGAVFGAGRSFLEDSPLFNTIINDAFAGLTLGSGLGAGGAYLQKMVKGQQLKNYDVQNIFGSEFKKYKNLANNFYKDFLQGINLNLKNLGDVSITKKGLDETISKNPAMGKIFPDLLKKLKQAEYYETNQLYKPRKDQATKQFIILKDANNKYFIAEDKNGAKKFYLAKRDTADQGTPEKTSGTSSGGINLGKNSAYTGQAQMHELEPNFIIPNSSPDFNPARNKNPQAVSGLQTSGNNYSDKQHIPLSDLGLSKNIIPNTPQDFNPAQVAIPPSALSQLNSSGSTEDAPVFNLGIEMNVDNYGNKIFTPDEGDIDYKNFKNPLSGDAKIYTREDISKMSSKEFDKYEKEIMAQLNAIGIPFQNDLPKDILTHSEAKKNSYATKTSSDGRWVTINGNHVFIDK